MSAYIDQCIAHTVARFSVSGSPISRSFAKPISLLLAKTASRNIQMPRAASTHPTSPMQVESRLVKGHGVSRTETTPTPREEPQWLQAIFFSIHQRTTAAFEQVSSLSNRSGLVSQVGKA